MALKRAFTVSGLVSREEMEVTQMQEESSPFISKEEDVEVVSKKPQPTNRGDIKPGLTSREEEIKNIVGDDKDLRKEMYDYLSYIKENKGIEKVSINDLSDDEFAELKSLLVQIKDMIDKIA